MKLPNIRRSLAAVLMLITGCKSFIDIDAPKGQVVSEIVFTTDETALSALRGLYAQMITSNGFASGYLNSVTLLAGRSADELTNFINNVAYQQFAFNNISPDNTNLRSGLWQEPYKHIYSANVILENLVNTSQLSAEVKTLLEGECKFIRAFCLFYLTNMFGEVPIILSTDYRVNATAAASSQAEIYAQVIQDLTEAKALLTETYPSADRARVNKYAVIAMLARVYLYRGEWAKAEAEATAVITRSDLYELQEDIETVFLKSSKETIFQLAPSLTLNINTREGQLFILAAAPGAATQTILNEDLYEAFDPADLRLSKWVGIFSNAAGRWYYPAKYKVRTGGTPSLEYSVVMRLAEQYLIRAEARAQQNNISGALADLNEIRRRVNLDPLDTADKEVVLATIQSERRFELFTEWGHRWFDLKRTRTADAILGTVKAPDWRPTDVLYPVPLNELNNNPNLKQNPGYN